MGGPNDLGVFKIDYYGKLFLDSQGEPYGSRIWKSELACLSVFSVSQIRMSSFAVAYLIVVFCL